MLGSMDIKAPLIEFSYWNSNCFNPAYIKKGIYHREAYSRWSQMPTRLSSSLLTKLFCHLQVKEDNNVDFQPKMPYFNKVIDPSQQSFANKYFSIEQINFGLNAPVFTLVPAY